mmetsp:Transcript_35849/g.107088  ORF Transcript_35849/g.107088 Transcript_35849/m.107088 type:complete len:265 (-) Transcript_35849:121-915(-)
MGQQWAVPADPAAPHPVLLHIYDLSTDPDIVAINRVLRSVLGTGAFHCGVEVYMKEWSFRKTRVGTGVFWELPQRCPGASYCDSIFMGHTFMSEREVHELLQAMSADWLGSRYDVLKRNCCHFSAELCRHLGAGEVFPEWILNLASTGNDIVEGIGAVANEVDKCGRCIKGQVDTLTECTPVQSSFLCGSVTLCGGCTNSRRVRPQRVFSTPSVAVGTRYEWDQRAGNEDMLMPRALVLPSRLVKRPMVERTRGGGQEIHVMSF